MPAEGKCGVRGWLAAAAEYRRGPAGLGLQLNYDTCDDGHAHAASSTHMLSYTTAYVALHSSLQDDDKHDARREVDGQFQPLARSFLRTQSWV